jgi:hypothetical protein
MINAMLADRKTQTRRLVNPQPPENVTSAGVISRSTQGQTDEWSWLSGDPTDCDTWGFEGDFKVSFRPGDRIYVRETYFQRGHWEPVAGRQTKGGRQKWAFVPADDVILFDAPASFRKGRHAADPAAIAWHQRLGRFMPRAASRLTLIVEAVRVERLQAISDADAIAEGVACWVCGGPVDGTSENDCDCFHTRAAAIASYAVLWETLHGEGSWEANPFVVAVSFHVVRGNIDQVPA